MRKSPLVKRKRIICKIWFQHLILAWSCSALESCSQAWDTPVISAAIRRRTSWGAGVSRHQGGPIKASPKAPRTSRPYVTEGFKRAPQSGPRCTERLQHPGRLFKSSSGLENVKLLTSWAAVPTFPTKGNALFCFRLFLLLLSRSIIFRTYYLNHSVQSKKNDVIMMRRLN